MNKIGFKDSVIHTLKSVFDFDSCSTRTEYLYYQLFRIICAVIMLLLAIIIGYFGDETIPKWLGLGFGVPLFLLGLYIIFADIPLSVRRLHDTNKSRWWYLVSCIPYIGWAILLFLLLRPSDPDSDWNYEYIPEND